MPMQMDALGAFTYLSDNIPTWMTQLSDLSTHCATKHAEFAEAFKKHSAIPSKPRKRRNSSVCSIQTDSAGSEGAVRPRRLRSSGSGSNTSSFDSARNGPAIISTRHSLIIHYDGYTQKTLEELVRSIGTARNNLRKGKMAQLPLVKGMRGGAPPPRGAAGARALLPTLDSEDDILASIRSARTRGPSPIQQQQQSTTRQPPFDLADKNLELAHSFCETAAYHFLRAGGCAEELKSVKDRFNVLLKLAREEVEILQKEKQEEAKQKEREKEEENEISEDTTETKPAIEIATATATATEPGMASLKRPASSEGPIEVDDEQGSVESIDLTVFRVNRMRR
ncbi:uncharacterized protein BDV17DRAFT_241016 [Aspergillus undulatus]|uniref:uncharacterized protein n=1 Tax=Aspergillus undulatus TaxID=1810928 RepID=UPI003CCDAF18